MPGSPSAEPSHSVRLYRCATRMQIVTAALYYGEISISFLEIQP
jgi:hypothetical protein